MQLRPEHPTDAPAIASLIAEALGEPAYYGRWGFVAHEGLSYPGVPPEYFMALAFGGEVPRGEVAYHAAFAAT